MRHGALSDRRARDLHADDPLPRSSAGGCPSSPRRRGRSGGRRSRIAGRSEATSPTRRPPATRCPSWPPRRRFSFLRSAGGTRRVPFNSFYTGYRTSVARPDELIVAVEVPPVAGRQWFRKVGQRAAIIFSRVVMAAVRAPRPRIALGSVAPTVVRLPGDRVGPLRGRLDRKRRDETLAREIQPIDDIRSTAQYRRRVCQNLLGAGSQQENRLTARPRFYCPRRSPP